MAIRSKSVKYASVIFGVLIGWAPWQGLVAQQKEAEAWHPGGNLVINGDFMSSDPEGRPSGWVTGRELQTAVLARTPHHGRQPGDCSLEMADSSRTTSVRVRSQKRIASPGSRYVATAWVKRDRGEPAALSLECWDQNNRRIGERQVVPAAEAGWQEVSVSLQAPDSVTHVTVAIRSTRDGTGLSYWDDVSLYDEAPYVPRVKTGVRELFEDNYRIRSLQDVARVVHPGKKSPPLIVPTEPWEGNAAYIYGTVLYDQPRGSGYRMWYTAYSRKNYYLCYATSADGITWKKPDLGIIEYDGDKHNNICRIGGGTLVYDPYSADPARRYKLMAAVAADSIRGRPFGYGVFFSPDGLHWKAYEGNPVISYADVSAVAYDTARRLFIASTKQRMLVSHTSVTPGKMDRAAFLSTSTDFTHWTAPGRPGSPWALAVEGDPLDDWAEKARGGLETQIYGMTLHPYASGYIGLPWVFDIDDYDTGVFAPYGDGPIQPQIAFSRDLLHWSRPDRDPVIPLGVQGAWDDGAIYTASSFVMTDRQVILYYGGMNLGHGGSRGSQTQVARIARATWRRDGFISLANGGEDTGIVTTRLLVFGGKTLRVNARITGTLRVEVLDTTGKPVPGFSLREARAIRGDQLSGLVSWRAGNDLSSLKNKPVRLRFYLKGGDLYAYWFSDENK